MDESTVTAKGQTTIPKRVREHMGVKPGDRVRFFVRADGIVMMLPVIPVSKLRGMLKHDGPPVSLEEMDEAIAAGAAGEPIARR